MCTMSKASFIFIAMKVQTYNYHIWFQGLLFCLSQRLLFAIKTFMMKKEEEERTVYIFKGSTENGLCLVDLE